MGTSHISKMIDCFKKNPLLSCDYEYFGNHSATTTLHADVHCTHNHFLHGITSCKSNHLLHHVTVINLLHLYPASQLIPLPIPNPSLLFYTQTQTPSPKHVRHHISSLDPRNQAHKIQNTQDIRYGKTSISPPPPPPPHHAISSRHDHVREF